MCLSDAAASALHWWKEAGFDSFIAENPRDWLAQPTRPGTLPSSSRPNQASPGSVSANPAPLGLPDDLIGLHELLKSGAYASDAAPAARRVAPSGDPASGLMIIADMPEPGDAEAGALFAGETARLFDAMLAAMRRGRASVYIAPFSPARLPGGRINAKLGETLASLMRRHISLAAPRGVILFGDESSRLLLGETALEIRGGLRALAHDGGTVPAISVFHPRHLRQYPALKAAVWGDMRLLTGSLAS
jgi:uracil-DNA glycosylase